MYESIKELAQFARLAYMEHIIRGNEQDPHTAYELLSLDGNFKAACMVCGIALAKREYSSNTEIRQLLAHEFSNSIGPRQRKKQKWLRMKIDRGETKPKEVTIEMLQGTCLDWGSIEKLFSGESINSTRARRKAVLGYMEFARLHEPELYEKELENPEYAHLLNRKMVSASG